MPKVNYTNEKGLYQESGSGVDLTTGAGLNNRRAIVDGSGGNVTLSATDSDYANSLSKKCRSTLL